MSDVALVEAQLGRTPRTSWRVARRCPYDRPAVIANAPRSLDETPFPTLFWLTCPHLVRELGSIESSGGVTAWAELVEGDAHLRFEVLAADQQYRAARQMEGLGDDPCGDVGVAGQKDPCATKCLHAHAAAYLAGIPDPAGAEALRDVALQCDSDECAQLLLRCGSGSEGEGVDG
jgi:hypothetical protein